MGSGMTDPDTIAALGKQLGARYVVAGNISALGNNRLLIISIIKIDDLQQIAGDMQTYSRIEEIRGKLPAMVRTIIAAASVDTANLPKLAIVPFQVRGTTNDGVADVLAQLLAIYIVQSGKYAVYPRTASLEQVQAEYTNQASGNTADENLVRMGAGVNPKYVLSGAARKLGTTLNMFNASIINLETGIQETGKSVDYATIDDGINAIQTLAAELSGGQAALVSGKPAEQKPIVQKPVTQKPAKQKPEVQKPAAREKPPKPEKAAVQTDGDFTTGRRIVSGFGNLALGAGSFTMGDWAGGAIVAGGYAAAAGLMLWDIFGLEYEDKLAGVPGGIGIGVAAASAVFGFVRPFFFHRSGQTAILNNSPVDGLDIVLVPDTNGNLAAQLSYTLHF
jgi:TolB-like protein